MRALLAVTIAVALGSVALAHEDLPAKAFLRETEATSLYSPYAGRRFPTRALWGDTHVHTSYSLDAGALGCRLDPLDAYRFAHGEEVVSSTGQRVRLARPLDFVVVADHSDNLGFVPKFLLGDPAMLLDPMARRIHEMMRTGGESAVRAGTELLDAFRGHTLPPALLFGAGSSGLRGAWNDVTKAAERANAPGRFTTFIAFEWTPDDAGGANEHRVVVYRDDATQAGQMEPFLTAAPGGSADPRELWKWLAEYEKRTGGRILAIPHARGPAAGPPQLPAGADREWAALRRRFEPLVQVTSMDGDDASVTQRLVDSYQLGIVGGTDSHTGLATADEDNFFGQHISTEPSPTRMRAAARQLAASGLTAVWAADNTRQAIFDAMVRREVYATTGSRIAVRFFAGFDFQPSDARERDPALVGYAKGVPMGGQLDAAPHGKPATFLVAALKDPLGGNLDRVQIVKGWVDRNGTLAQRVYDVAVSGGRAIDDAGRCTTDVGDTVDVRHATWTNTIGAAEIVAHWQDPAFDAEERALYYARVIEIPTPRWTSYDAKRFGLETSADVALTTRETAQTSPIWYSPTR